MLQDRQDVQDQGRVGRDIQSVRSSARSALDRNRQSLYISVKKVRTLMSTTTVNIAFQENLLHDIDRVARSESRSRSEFLREAARAYIQRKQRWADVFTMGRGIAKAKGLLPTDVSKEIKAHRKSKASRS